MLNHYKASKSDEGGPLMGCYRCQNFRFYAPDRVVKCPRNDENLR